MQASLRRFAHVALTLALLAGWNAGLLHPLEHSDDRGRLVHLADLHAGGEQKPASAPSDRLCDVLAGLAACLDNAPAVVDRPQLSGQESILQFSGEPRPAAPPPFFAQGPPILL